jgi:hypothetical protein
VYECVCVYNYVRVGVYVCVCVCVCVCTCVCMYVCVHECAMTVPWSCSNCDVNARLSCLDCAPNVH